MLKKLTKIFLAAIIVSSFLGVAGVAEAEGVNEEYEVIIPSEYVKEGNIERNLGGVCTHDWCDVDAKGTVPVDLFCDPSPAWPAPNRCQDVITYCNNNKNDRVHKDWDAHDKQIFIQGVDIVGCDKILANQSKIGATANLASAKQDATRLIGELDGTIAAAKAGGVDVTAAGAKFKAASTALDTAKTAEPSDPAKAKLFYDKAAQYATEGLQAVGAQPSATDSMAGSDSKPGSSAAPARVITGPGLVTPASGIQGISGLVSAEELGVGIINFFLSFVGIIAVAMLVYGGFLYVTAAGDPAKSGKGKNVIIGAVIGIIIIIGSWTIVNTVINLQGGTGGGGGAGSSATIARAVQVTISGTSILGANVQGTVTAYQGQTVQAQLTGSTASGFISNQYTIDVTLNGATVMIGGTSGAGGVSLPAQNSHQVPIEAVSPLRKGKVDILVLQ